MNTAAAVKPQAISITRENPNLPILVAYNKTELAIRAGTVIEIGGLRHAFEDVTYITLDDLKPGQDYGITLRTGDGPIAVALDTADIRADIFAGFHFAPGGNAQGRTGGDTDPAINPFSLWDLDFRPSCADPRSMTLVDMAVGRRVWVDIYLLGRDHKAQGTSRHGVKIADGASLDCLDFKTAKSILAEHGKRLLTYDEFRAAAFGVTEKSATSRDPDKTGLDPARTSRFGLMQATGNLWIWGTDGDEDDPRPSLFGGSWLNGSSAGSRHATLDCNWPEDSSGDISCRAACDHMSPA